MTARGFAAALAGKDPDRMTAEDYVCAAKVAAFVLGLLALLAFVVATLAGSS